MRHQLNTQPDLFEALWDGRKTFEVRRDDRGFQALDEVWLREYGRAHGQQSEHYSGRSITARIGYVLHNLPPRETLGLFVAFSLLRVRRHENPDAIGTYSAWPDWQHGDALAMAQA